MPKRETNPQKASTERGRKMNIAGDSEVWQRLARRINDRLRASRDNNIRFLWLDGFVPDRLRRNSTKTKVLATAFVTEGDGKSDTHYRVEMHLSTVAADAFRMGEWNKLLPPADSDRWLKVDRAAKEIGIACR
jgi:hypothetical protein